MKGYLYAIKLEQSPNEETIKSINLRMNGFSISEIQQILRDAYLEHGRQLTTNTIEGILKGFKPREIKELLVEVP